MKRTSKIRPAVPAPVAVMVCPKCRNPLAASRIFCPACGAEKKFGPFLRELLTAAIIGLFLGGISGFLVFRSFPLAILVSALGLLTSATFAQFRFSIERWQLPKKRRGQKQQAE